MRPPARAAGNPERRRVDVDRHRVGRVGLQLDRVGAGAARRLHDRDRRLQLVPVVRRELGDYECGMPGADHATRNRDHARAPGTVFSRLVDKPHETVALIVAGETRRTERAQRSHVARLHACDHAHGPGRIDAAGDEIVRVAAAALLRGHGDRQLCFVSAALEPYHADVDAPVRIVADEQRHARIAQLSVEPLAMLIEGRGRRRDRLVRGFRVARATRRAARHPLHRPGAAPPVTRPPPRGASSRRRARRPGRASRAPRPRRLISSRAAWRSRRKSIARRERAGRPDPPAIEPPEVSSIASRRRT